MMTDYPPDDAISEAAAFRKRRPSRRKFQLSDAEVKARIAAMTLQERLQLIADFAAVGTPQAIATASLLRHMLDNAAIH